MPLTPKGYTTKTAVEDVLNATLDASYDSALDDLIAKAEGYVDAATRRHFDQQVGTRDLFITRPGTDVLYVPDTLSLTSITVDPYLTAAFDLGDENFNWRLEGGKQGGPFTRLRLIFSQDFRHRLSESFPAPSKVTLEGSFGWSDIPATIREATTLLAVDATRRWREAKAGDVASVTMGQFSVTYDMARSAAAIPGWRRLIRPFVRAKVPG